jgi:hypothetical protein
MQPIRSERHCVQRFGGDFGDWGPLSGSLSSNVLYLLARIGSVYSPTPPRSSVSTGSPPPPRQYPTARGGGRRRDRVVHEHFDAGFDNLRSRHVINVQLVGTVVEPQITNHESSLFSISGSWLNSTGRLLRCGINRCKPVLQSP